MDSIVLWQHKWSADLFIPTYLFFGGLTAGVVFVACLADLLSAKFPRLASLSRSAAIAAVPLLGLAGFFLTVHLGKPERGLGFPLFFTNYESWMTRGGWIVATDAPIVLVYAALWYFRVFPQARRLLAILGLPAQVLLSLYTGMLLSGAGFVPLWSKEYLPLLFLSSALTTGTAAAGLILVLAKRLAGEAGEDSRATLRWLSLAVTVLLLVELYRFALSLTIWQWARRTRRLPRPYPREASTRRQAASLPINISPAATVISGSYFTAAQRKSAGNSAGG